MMGPLILGPMFSALAVAAMAMVCIASATAYAMYSLVFICLFTILLLSLTGFVFFQACLCEAAFSIMLTC